MSLSPARILRDASLAAVVVVVGAAWWGQAGGAAAGALAGLVNYLLLWRAVVGVQALLPRILGAHVVAFASLAALLSHFPAIPVLAGFCAPLVALGARAFTGLVPSRPPEHA